MKLDPIDLEILEAALYDEPWHILCGMLEGQFSDIRKLIPRIFHLQEEGLIEIHRDPGTDIDPTPEDLERIAINHEIYGTRDWPEGPTWSIETTEKGFQFVEHRFE
jgi:hypothetical protein